jgi:hypothetical protein
MILGLSTSAFTTFHVVLSLIGILAGVIVLATFVGNTWRQGWTVMFLVTTIATSVTGFFFRSTSIGPPHIFGVISLVVLAVALYALYGRRLAGIWRPVYLGTTILALYLNVVVGVVQAFQKLTFLQPFAPTQSEPPFLLAQAVVLVFFVVSGFLALRNFQRPLDV